MLLERILNPIIREGGFTVIDSGGRRHVIGEETEASQIVIRLRDKTLERKLALHPQLALGEAYMDGTLTFEKGGLYELMDLIGRNFGIADPLPGEALRRFLGRALRRLQQFNPMGRSQRNVAHHYDLNDKLYSLFLDKDRQYSCAYFERPDATLEEAQLAKKRHIAAKLLLEPGQKVLDIGSGWGGMALYLAEAEDVDVTGITLSKEQHALSQKRSADAGLGNRVRFKLEDYRAQGGLYDRIVSVGMFEHVGVPHYAAFFGKMRNLLADNGVALLHAIGRSDGPGVTNPWIRKYIFPGGYVPALSEVLPAIERAGLWVTDIEILRIHYAETLRHWRERFMAHWSDVAAIYDERFCRMWEFYLIGSEITFRHRGHMVFQIQIAKRVDTVPLTRDYVGDWEHRLRQRSELAA